MNKYRIMYDALNWYYIQELKSCFLWLIKAWRNWWESSVYGNFFHTTYYRRIKQAQLEIDKHIDYKKKESIPDKIIEYYP